MDDRVELDSLIERALDDVVFAGRNGESISLLQPYVAVRTVSLAL
jgi:hypothetical protein